MVARSTSLVAIHQSRGHSLRAFDVFPSQHLVKMGHHWKQQILPMKNLVWIHFAHLHTPKATPTLGDGASVDS
jgi:hypothetical protein